MTASTPSLVTQPRFFDRLKGFVALTKPRVIELLLVTTVPTMVVAERGNPGLGLMAATVIGGSLSAGGANAVNMVVDRDIDAVMERTRNRPLVTGVVAPTEALAFAVAIEVVAFVWLWQTVNLLSGLLALGACAFYVFVYTLWLKRTSTQNIVIGGAAGAAPTLIGWSAVTDEVGWAAVVLFVLVFLWTPPHFWALAIKYRDDYAAVDVPMLPSVAPLEETGRQIVVYAVLTVAASLVFVPVAPVGWIYGVAAVLSGVAFVVLSERVRRTPETGPAMRLFAYSISYLLVLFAAMAVDVLVLG